jgi:hypothetical protein
MINLFNKIAIFNYINKNKDKVEYKFDTDLDASTGIHNVKITDKGMVSVSMHRNISYGTVFFMEYRLKENDKSTYKIVKPWQQSFLDRFFISKMYSKMFSNYVRLHGVPNNSNTH